MNQDLNQTQSPNVDLTKTTSIETPEGGKVFQQGLLLRKVSKFLVGANEDAILPIPVFFDPKTGKILESSIPSELRHEYKDQIL